MRTSCVAVSSQTWSKEKACSRLRVLAGLMVTVPSAPIFADLKKGAGVWGMVRGGKGMGGGREGGRNSFGNTSKAW